MKNSALILLLAIITLAPSLALAESSFSLGVILPLTGKASDAADACQNAITMAHESLPPELRAKFKLIYEDDANVPKNTVSSFKKLTSITGVNAIVTFASNTSKAVSPLADRLGIPLIAVASDPNVVLNRKYVVNFWVSPTTQVELLLEEMRKHNYKKIARITAIQDGLLAYVQEFDRLSGDQVEVLLDEQHSPEEKDFRPFLLKVRTQPEIDAIFVNLYFGQTGLFAKQARELGIRLPLINIETFEDPPQIELSNGTLVGQWYIQADDTTGKFLAEYTKRFPGASTYTAGNCHDLVLLIADAISKNNPLNDFLHEVKDFTGAMGQFSATGDNRFSLPATVKVVTNNGFEQLYKRDEH